MRRITALLVSFFVSLPTALAQPLQDEAACLEGRAAFSDCVYAIQEARTVVSTPRSIGDSGSTGVLNIAYIIAEFGGLRDGIDPNVLAFLKFEYLIDGQLVHRSHKKVGAFLSFDSFTRPEPGKYLFSGQIFSDEGCLAQRIYDVDAADYTIALRRNDGRLPNLRIAERTGGCD